MIETISALLTDLFLAAYSTAHSTYLLWIRFSSCRWNQWQKLCPTSGKLYDGADGCDRLIMLLIIFNLQWINRILPGLALLNNIKAFKIAYSIK